jgi:hypothetical protein
VSPQRPALGRALGGTLAAALAFSFLLLGLVGPAGATRTRTSTSKSTDASSRTHSSSATSIIDDPSVEPGKRLTLDLDTGASLRIRGWDRHSFRIDYEDQDDLCPGAEVNVDHDDQGVTVTSRFHDPEVDHSCSMVMIIRVPSRYDIHVQSAGGEVNIQDVEGSFDGRTGGGDIELTRVRGHAKLWTGGGDIRLMDATLEGHLNTGGGVIERHNVKGSVTTWSGSESWKNSRGNSR